MDKNYKNGKEIHMNEFLKPGPEVGILEWFHLNDTDHVQKAVESMKELGVKHLRTGLSWADYHTPSGEKWYDWLIPYLSEHFDILPCFLYTPPSIAIEPKSSAPPQNPKDFADFIDTILKKYGDHFEYVELWNEPNNQSEYDFVLDDSWSRFTEMIRMASYWVRQCGKKSVLGGMSPIDPNWLKHIAELGALEFIDVIGIHGFPGVFESHWNGWEYYVTKVKEVLKSSNLSPEVWITETGYSTWKYDERIQLQNFLDVLDAPVQRVYWYALTDLPQNISTVDGFHLDDREYFFGLITEGEEKKLLYRLWADGGVKNISRNAWMTGLPKFHSPNPGSRILITGGAGFIGTNLADHLLVKGMDVTIYDNLSRAGVEKNLDWLRSRHKNLKVIIADVRDKHMLEQAVCGVTHVYHLAAQVAVTSSLVNPVYDFEVNLKGTINLLEAIRKSPHQPSLIFTSTNKVYGDLNDIVLEKSSSRYYPAEPGLAETGIGEDRKLDFHSPYGSSKGAADQYILDYSRSFGIKTMVFRMSCIYGPHQFGTEDQGWVAHFILKALRKETITLFGDGLQVRDILFVEDLVRAFEAAHENIDRLQGEVYNIGGGPNNVISLLELVEMIESLHGQIIPTQFEDWRKGDQRYYVSDYRKFRKATGWQPEVQYEKGIKMLYDWLAGTWSVPVNGEHVHKQQHTTLKQL